MKDDTGDAGDASSAPKWQRGLSSKGKKMPGKISEAEPKAAEDGQEKRGKKKLVIMAAPAVLVVAALAWFLFLKPSGPSEPPPPTPGPVVQLDPITINLAGGHFLKLGLALQPTADAGEEVSGAKALDAAIALYSGKTVSELSTGEGREKTKAKLVTEVSELYEKLVYDVYLTEFVMQ